ncbi:MAG: 2-oxo acid dehydrogenase subunit E2 [Faecousia sp.]
MEKRKHFYVSRKNVLTWLMALCLTASAVARIVFACMKGTEESENVWSLVVLPVAATLLFVLIALLNGKERFYQTALPVWILAIFYAIRPHTFIQGGLMLSMFIISLAFFCLVYTNVTDGKFPHVWLLFPMCLVPLAFMVYYYQGASHAAHLSLLPDFLIFLGIALLSLGIHIHPDGEYHPTWGDRADGRRIRSLAPMDMISPYFMPDRNGAMNYYADAIEITPIERYIRQKRKEGLTNFGITHVLLAAYVRTLCKYPKLNRFLAGQKLYSRGDDVVYCMTVKKDMNLESPDTVIKVHLRRTDTAEDVYHKFNAAIEEARQEEESSSFDSVANGFTLIPGVVLKFTVWLLKLLDYFGLVPMFLLEVSPFHGSLYFTSMGSLGIPPVYHHLYNFGNLPVFGAFGCKRKAMELQEDGTVVQRKYVDMQFTLDERIIDGYYYATFFKAYKRLLRTPEVLDEAPTEINSDID